MTSAVTEVVPARIETPGVAEVVASTILVVDDNPDNRESLSRRLARRGFKVDTADGGHAALKAVDEKAYDLILLDIMMPDLSGIEVLRQIRTNRSAVELPIVMATAQNASEDVVKALELGANDYVTKPLDFPVVLARVQTHLRLKHIVARVLELEKRLADQNAQLMAAAEQTRFELDAAARVQAAFLPKSSPPVPGLKFAWAFKPSAELAGDSLNVVQLGPNVVGFYVLDVSGHGVAAALLAVAATRLLSPTGGAESLLLDANDTGQLHAADPARVAERLNQRLPWDAQTRQYLTLFYATFDVASRVLRYAAAGHPPPLVVHADGSVTTLQGGDLPIGIDLGTFSQHEATVRPGDRVYLYTDGVTETANPAGKMFEADRLAATITREPGVGLEESVTRIVDAINAWRESPAAADDVSVLAMAYEPSGT